MIQKNLTSNSSDDTSLISIFDDDCDKELNQWFETFFYHIDQAIFYDKKLNENYEKIEKECTVWNKLFKLKNINLMNPEIKNTVFSLENLKYNKPQLIEKLDRKKKFNFRKANSVPENDTNNSSSKKMVKFNKNPTNFSELQENFDKLTNLNQIKQDYIKKHVLNSSFKLPEYSFNQNFDFNKNSKKKFFSYKSNENTDTQYLKYENQDNSKINYLTFFNEENQNLSRSVRSIIKIDKTNYDNFEINTEQIIHPRSTTPLILPPILKKSDVFEKFDDLNLNDFKKYDYKSNHYLNRHSFKLNKNSAKLSSAFPRPPIIFSFSENQIEKK